MKCAACGYTDWSVEPHRKPEPFEPVVIEFPEPESYGTLRIARVMPTSNLYACPKCRTVRRGD